MALVASGCGTLYNHEIGPCPKSRPDTFRLYGGIRKDLEAAAACMATSTDPQAPAAERAGALGGAVAYLALDLPLSAAADTLLLPVTLGSRVEKRRGTWATSDAIPDE